MKPSSKRTLTVVIICTIVLLLAGSVKASVKPVVITGGTGAQGLKGDTGAPGSTSGTAETICVKNSDIKWGSCGNGGGVEYTIRVNG